jgi:hypothetical protein
MKNTIAADVAAIKNAASLQALDAMYVDFVGYSRIEDEPSVTAETLRDDLLDYQREICYSVGVHCASVGL